MRLRFFSETLFYVYPIQTKGRISLLWDNQLEAISVGGLYLDSGSYEAVFLGRGMAIRRHPSREDWQERVFALTAGDPHYFNISVEQGLLFCASEDFAIKRVSKLWQQFLEAMGEKTQEGFPPIELKAPPSLRRTRLGELKQQPNFLGQVVRGVRARHVIVRQSPGCTYMVCLYGPEDMKTCWSCYPDAVRVRVESQDYWLRVCEEQWQRIVRRHPEVLSSN